MPPPPPPLLFAVSGRSVLMAVTASSPPDHSSNPHVCFCTFLMFHFPSRHADATSSGVRFDDEKGSSLGNKQRHQDHHPNSTTAQHHRYDYLYLDMDDSVLASTYSMYVFLASLQHCYISGYPFIAPSMVGPHADNDALPDRELYIRWVQAVCMMPCVKMSLPPWMYDDDVVK